MDALVDFSWRALPAALLIALGAALAASGLRREFEALRAPAPKSDTPLALARGLRRSILGLAVVALGAAWTAQQLWLAVLAAIIGGGEMMETSMFVYALRRQDAQIRARAQNEPP